MTLIKPNFLFAHVLFLVVSCAVAFSSFANDKGLVRFSNGEGHILPAQFFHSKNKNIKLLVGAGTIVMTSDSEMFKKWVSSVRKDGKLFFGVGLSAKGCPQQFVENVAIMRADAKVVRLQGETLDGILLDFGVSEAPYRVFEEAAGKYVRVILKKPGEPNYCFVAFDAKHSSRQPIYAKAKNALAATIGSSIANEAMAQRAANQNKKGLNSSVKNLKSDNVVNKPSSATKELKSEKFKQKAREIERFVFSENCQSQSPIAVIWIDRKERRAIAYRNIRDRDNEIRWNMLREGRDGDFTLEKSSHVDFEQWEISSDALVQKNRYEKELTWQRCSAGRLPPLTPKAKSTIDHIAARNQYFFTPPPVSTSKITKEDLKTPLTLAREIFLPTLPRFSSRKELDQFIKLHPSPYKKDAYILKTQTSKGDYLDSKTSYAGMLEAQRVGQISWTEIHPALKFMAQSLVDVDVWPETKGCSLLVGHSKIYDGGIARKQFFQFNNINWKTLGVNFDQRAQEYCVSAKSQGNKSFLHIWRLPTSGSGWSNWNSQLSYCHKSRVEVDRRRKALEDIAKICPQSTQAY